MNEDYYKDFGFANGWAKDPEVIAKCKELKHKVSDSSDKGPYPFDNTVVCHICKYIYHYDSS